MTADFALLLLAGILCAAGVYLLLERAIIKILLGIMIMSNGVNLLILAAGGPPGTRRSAAGAGATTPPTRIPCHTP
ncbi:NADH-quinone oxidoreductase subunit K [Dietzia aerolata]|uniref:NADH-quinone oxidoreductase subunit K n=1 Tax=Dietzia aerolata TaxID=595984 RepID=UPI003625328C